MYKLKLVILLFLLFAAELCAAGQNSITVKAFHEAPSRTDAVVHPITDPASGEKCAVIIVTGVEAGGFRFGFGSSYSKVEEIKTDDGAPAYFIYVAPGVRMVTISNRNPSIQTLHDYRFPIPIKKATTYFMELGEIYLSTQKQYLEFTVSPAEAYLEVDGAPWILNENGYVSKSVPFGTYNYIAKADLYYPEPGVVTVNDAAESAKVVLKLRPAFGFLTIDGGAELERANIVVDDKFIGTGNIRQVRLGSGLHTLKISKDLYITYIDSIRIKDNTEIQLTPKLKSNAASVRIKASEMDIYLDDNKLGYDEWTGRLEPGDYVFEGRKEGHRPSKIQISVHNGNEKIYDELPAPEPIYGSVDIETTPPGVRITIDGEVKGNSPLTVPGILIGKHKVDFYRDGYETATQTIEVQEGMSTSVKQTMSNVITVRISAPSSASLKIDGDPQKLTESGRVSVQMLPGEHIVEAEPVEPGGNRSYYKTLNFSRNSELYIKHPFKMSQRNSVYAMIGGAVGSMQNLSATLGCHFGGLTFEAEYQYAGLNDGVICNSYVVGDDGHWQRTSVAEVNPDHIFCLRAGWRVIVGSKFAVMPLVGFRCALAEIDAQYPEDASNEENYNGRDGKQAISVTAAVRFTYKWNRYFGLALTPEFYQKAGAAYAWNRAAAFSDKARSYMTGYGVSLSFLIDF